MNNYLLYWIFLFYFLGISASLEAQRTIRFRITAIESDIADMDAPSGDDSDPQWNYSIQDICNEQSTSGNRQLSGTNCPGLRTINDVFFTGTYDCNLPNFTFVWRAFEDDGATVEANTGNASITIPSSALTVSGANVWTTINTYTATSSGSNCAGGSTVTWRITLQYEITGSQAACVADECVTALALPNYAPYQCGNTQISTPINITLNAPRSCGRGSISPSASSILCPIARNPPQDIWLRLRVPNGTGGAVIGFENLGGCAVASCATNIYYAWYTSSNGSCSGLTYRGCGYTNCIDGCTNGNIRVDGRAGEDIWIRIWERDDEGFSINLDRLTPTVPADRCYTSLPLSGSGCNYQATSPDSGPYAELDSDPWTQRAHPGNRCQDGDNDVGSSNFWTTNDNLVWYTYTHIANGDFSVAVDDLQCIGANPTAQLGLFRNLGSPNSPTCDLATTQGMGCSVGRGAVELLIPNLPAGDYILVVDGTGGAQCVWSFRDRIGGTLLPLRWLGFDGQMSENRQQALLHWQTADEEMNRGFSVQRSSNGIHFEDIAFVPANNSGNYSYEDATFPRLPVLYYRLRQLDMDGDAMFSRIIAITTQLDLHGASILQEPFPNPAREELILPFYISAPDKVSVWLYDASGRVVLQPLQQQAYNEGQHQLQIPLPAELPAGIYTLRFQSTQGTQIKRFAKYK